jgi:hypothetical protein
MKATMSCATAMSSVASAVPRQNSIQAILGQDFEFNGSLGMDFQKKARAFVDQEWLWRHRRVCKKRSADAVLAQFSSTLRELFAAEIQAARS